MPLFECTRCSHKVRVAYELSCIGDVRRNVEKVPECCGKPVIETLND